MAATRYLPLPVLFCTVAVILGLMGWGCSMAIPIEGGGTAALAQWLFFCILTACMLALGRATVRHRNPNLFSGIILGGSMIKLFGSLLFLFVYRKIAQPTDRHYLALFFLFYAGFTILEIVLLQRMVREEADSRRSDKD